MAINDRKKGALITGFVLFILGMVLGVPWLATSEDLYIPGLIFVEAGCAGFVMNISILVEEYCCGDKKCCTWTALILWIIGLCLSPNLIVFGMKGGHDALPIFIFGVIWAWIWFSCTVILITIHCCNGEIVTSSSESRIHDMELPSAPLPSAPQLPSVPQMFFQDKFQEKSTHTYDIPVATPV